MKLGHQAAEGRDEMSRFAQSRPSQSHPRINPLTTHAHVLKAVEAIAPPALAFPFDRGRIGLQIGDPAAECTGVVTGLDVDDALIDHALAHGANALVVHHPLIWEPLSHLRPGSRAIDLALRCLREGLAVIAAHTNWDCAPGGVSDVLAGRLGLKNVVPIGRGMPQSRLKLVVFVPGPNREAVQSALWHAGAGVIGDYTECSFWISGTGSFRGGEGTNPAIGEPGRREAVTEDRLEVVVTAEALSQALYALRQVHPYEEPAFDVIPLREETGPGPLRLGELDFMLPPDGLAALVQERLGHPTWLWKGRRPIRRVAVAGGAGASDWAEALRAGADALVTGEVKHDQGLDAAAAGLTLIAAGHAATEAPAMAVMADRLRENLAVPVLET